MNNGQAGQNLDNSGIFSSISTPDGAQINQNIAAVESVIGGNDQNIWAPERDNRNIGNKAISSNEIAPDAGVTKSPDMAPGTPGGLGEIVDLNPSIMQPAQQPAQDVSAALAFNEALIRTDGDHIAKSAIKEIDNAKNELNQTGDIFNFYDKARDMGETYKRKLVS